MTERKLYKPQISPFPIQADRGDIYQTAVKFIAAEPEDRYGWKKDHLAIWLDFDPAVGSTLGTCIELPIKEYTRDELLVAIMNEAQKLVIRLLIEFDQKQIEMAAEENHRAELDSCAERVSSLLESQEVTN